MFTGSLTDSSIAQKLKMDVAITQQMDQHLIGSLPQRPESDFDDLSTLETESTISSMDDGVSAHLQVS